MDIHREFRRLKRWAQVWGTKYQCPFCYRPLSTFKPAGLDVPVLFDKKVVGGGLRQNARCFICGSMDRERLVYLYLKNKTQFLERSTKILHIAPEPVLMKKLRDNKKINYLTADLKSPRADVKMDITAMPFDNNSFDLIIVNHVLEHVPDDRKAMREVHRILKPETGQAIMQVPISLVLNETYEDASIKTERERLAMFGQEDHVRIYGQDYSKKLEREGFRLVPFDWHSCDNLFPDNKNKYGLIEDEVLFVVTKQISA